MMKEDGFFKIVDRKKDMINVSGFNVYPNEIENVLYKSLVETKDYSFPIQAFYPGFHRSKKNSCGCTYSSGKPGRDKAAHTQAGF